MRYRVIDYFDVIGNREDGYEVNNLSSTDYVIDIDDDTTDKQILEKLVDVGYLITSDMRRLRVVSDATMIEVYSKGWFPVCRLEEEEA